MINFVTENDLKGYVPELDRLLWSDQADYSQQKQRAEEIVSLDLIDRGYPLRQLQTPLLLFSGTMTGESEAVTDRLSRTRLSVTGFTGTGTITLQGKTSGDWVNIVTVSGNANPIFINSFLSYRLKVVGSLTFTANLYEAVYDSLFAYKWLELILRDKFNNEGDQYWSRMILFRDDYNRKIGSMNISIDRNDDGTIEATESKSTNIVTMLR